MKEIVLIMLTILYLSSCSKYDDFQLIDYNEEAPNKVLETTYYNYLSGSYSLSNKYIYVYNKQNEWLRYGGYDLSENGDQFYLDYRRVQEISNTRSDYEYVRYNEDGTISHGRKWDVEGNIEIVFDWNEETQQWMNDAKYILNSKDDVEYVYNWNEELQSWENAYKYELEYAGDDLLNWIEYKWVETETWQLYLKADYTYSSLFTTIVYHVYNIASNEWEKDWKYEIEVDGFDNNIYRAGYSWNDQANQWEISYKDIWDYIQIAGESYQTLYEHYRILDSEFRKSYSYTYDYDSNGNMLTMDYEYYSNGQYYPLYRRYEHMSYGSDGKGNETIIYSRTSLDESWSISGKEIVNTLYVR